MTGIDVSDRLKAKGTRTTGYIAVGETSDGAALQLPVAVVTGERSGKTVWLNGGIHGDEYLGTAVLSRLIRAIRPSSVKGAIVVTPILNPLAHRNMRRTSPVDEVDMNRIWASPGLPFATSQIRDTVRSEILDEVEAVVDLHSGGNRFLQSAFTVYSSVGGPVGKASKELAVAAGIPMVWSHRGSILEGGLITAAAREGKPAVLIEVAGEGKSEEAWVGAMGLAVQRILGHLRIIDFPPSPMKSYRIFSGFHTVTSRRGGLFRRLLEPGAPMERGSPLGEVSDPFGRPLELIRSPAGPGYLLGICTYGTVSAGDYVAELATEVKLQSTRA